jgi:hypothetical protein
MTHSFHTFPLDLWLVDYANVTTCLLMSWSVMLQHPTHIWLLKLAAAYVLVSPISLLSQEVPASADQFVDSAGINVHLGYTDTLYYTKFPVIQSSLSLLHLRHVRDDEPVAAAPGFYTHHSALLAQGVHGEFATQITEQPTDISSYPTLFTSGYFEAFEPPNECDVNSNCGSPWAANLVAFLPELQQNAGSYPVYGPAFGTPSGAPAAGNVSGYTSYGNMHDYKGGWNPGFAGSWGWGYTNYLSTALSIQLAAITNPQQPYLTTETGYTNAVAEQDPQLGYPIGVDLPVDANAITEADSATYMPRLLLMGWLNGVKRTYLYELLSSPGQDYGLLRGDGSQKPAFGAVSHLLTLLSDPGPAFTLKPLTYTLTGGDNTTQHLLLQKRNGSYYLVLWLESSVYNKFYNQETPVTPQQVTVSSSCSMTSGQVYSWAPQTLAAHPANAAFPPVSSFSGHSTIVSVGSFITGLHFNCS